MSIESTHKKIFAKYSAIRAALVAGGGDPRELNAVFDAYYMATLSHQREYYESAHDPRADLSAVGHRYHAAVAGENIVGRLDDLAKAIRRDDAMMERLRVEPKIVRRLTQATDISIDGVESVKYMMCDCGKCMEVVEELSELRCDDCGTIRPILGMVFNDAQFFPPECSTKKSGTYELIVWRHFRFWMDRLQALESDSFVTPADAEKIEYVIRRDRIKPFSLTCALMRAILKDPSVRLTAYNSHVPLLVRHFGGRSPPILPAADIEEAGKKFVAVFKIYESLYAGDCNMKYYPYFIGRILRGMYNCEPASRELEEKKRIFDYFHRQSAKTMAKNDEIYKRICAAADPSDGLIYA